MTKPEKVLDFYINSSSLKKVVKSRKPGRDESYAEFIYKAQMLAVSLYNDNKDKYGELDLAKIVTMISLYSMDFINVPYPDDYSVVKPSKYFRDIHKELNDITTPNAKFAWDCLCLVDSINSNNIDTTYSGTELVFDEKKYELYNKCNRLRTLIRTGWLDWKVSAERLEVVAEHIYSTQMLAIALYSNFHKDYETLDINKVLLMILIHELGEASIGDLTCFQISKVDKIKIEHQAVSEMLGGLDLGYNIYELFLEFDCRGSKEAVFAHYCDKADCVLQAADYDENHYVDLDHQEGNSTYLNEDVQRILKSHKSFTKLFIQFWNERVPYDEPIRKVLDYAYKNGITHLAR